MRFKITVTSPVSYSPKKDERSLALSAVKRRQDNLMLKGVNKQIIEITDTENLYIQKAILFVNPEKQTYDRDFLLCQGKKYVKDIKSEQAPPPKPEKAKKLLPTLIKLSAGAALGATAASLLIR